jgi:ABC-2 type transport system permease protein
MIVKEFKQVFRDKSMLFLILVVPIMQLVLLSFAITTDVKHLKLLVVDQDGTTMSRDIVQAFSHTDRFKVVGATADARVIRGKMQAWQAEMALVIPPGFDRDLERGQNPQLQVVVDGVDGNAAEVASGYAFGILTNVGLDYLEKRSNLLRAMPIHAATMEERMWYNPELDSKQFMIPGIVVVLFTIIPMVLSAMGLVREREIGTLEQLLVTPMKKHELLAGKLIPFLILSYAELVLVVTAVVVGFRVTVHGSYLLLGLVSFLYLFTALGLGIFVSTIASSQQQAMFLAWFFMMLMIMLGGFFIPIENMPFIMQKITYLNPLRYFMSMVRDIFQKGSSIRFLVKDLVFMTAFGVVIFPFSIAKFQKRVR